MLLVMALLALASTLCAVGTRAIWFVIRGGFLRESLERDGVIGAVLAALAAVAQVAVVVAGFRLLAWQVWLPLLAASAALGCFVVTRKTWPFWHAFKPLVDFLAVACVALVWAMWLGFVRF